ncbi:MULTISPECIES: PadR family transcriptional regulator [Micrococcaceae]|uniref:PadR family transcriptional regulator n=1 Tax=Micrococcaceae TaxID=1268 RepID=UPI0010357F58|nr:MULTISPECIES: PadR family transcriptional regulator [Micrococcaceae]TAP28454.1 PadR family transcriptional regulator [Arthrobacter sp. S41]UXN32760.1 PadR family transcriptional regulator [Glutamicibacter sp. M10]
MIELMILGFLSEGRLHGYELRRRMEELGGHARKISDGTLYPAITRLAKAGYVTKESEPGVAGAQRQTLGLTEAGHVRLLAILRDASGLAITDLTHFFTVLTFLSVLPDAEERNAVLQRRLDFLEAPASFYSNEGVRVKIADMTDPYRRGAQRSARALRNEERKWIRELLNDNEGK